MSRDNAFAELGLRPDATESEVKAAWRRLASQWHPDRNASVGAVARMQRINQAFEQIRSAGFAVGGGDSAGRPERPARADAAHDADASGGHGAQAEAQRPPRRTLRRKLKLTLEEAALGCIKTLRGRITDPCAACAGAGHQVLGGHCARCGGSGALARRSFFGWPAGLVECEACLGGGIARRLCAACAGSGKAPATSYQVKVRIPQGLRDGDLLHVAAGGARTGRPPADIEIRIELLPHPLLRLEDDGVLRCEVPVDGFAWIANRAIEVPTLGGLQTLQLQRDQLAYRLPGQGFPRERRGARADQWVMVRPIFPQSLSVDQQILLDQLLATRSNASGEPLDTSLRDWQRALRDWQRGRPGEGPA